jgi:hypothetical protein
MPRQQVINPRDELYQRYQQHLTTALASFDQGASSESDGWWALWLIERDEEWRAEFGGEKVDYLGWLTLQPYAPSQGSYYHHMNAIRDWIKLGFTRSREIKWLLKGYKMAIGPDLRLLMDGDGFRADVEKNIRQGRETPKEFVARVAALGKGEARKEVLGKVFKNRFFFHREGALFDKKRKIILANLQHEHEDKGLLGIYTLSLRCVNTKTRDAEMPEEIAKWLCTKLGITLTEMAGEEES